MSVPRPNADVKAEGKVCPDPSVGISSRRVSAQWCSELVSEVPDSGLGGIKSALGTGKTVLIRHLTARGRAVYIAPLRSLEQAATKQAFGDGGVSRYGIRHGWYDDPEWVPGTKKEVFEYHQHLCATEARVATTYAGFQRGFFETRNFSNDTVILDEPMQMLTGALLGDIYAKDRRENVERLLGVIRRARRVILLDGHLEPWVVEMLAEHARIPTARRVFIDNIYRPKRGVVRVHDSPASLRCEIMRLWGKARILCLFTSRKALDDLRLHMQEVRSSMEENFYELYASTGEEPVIPELPLVVTPDTVESDRAVQDLLKNPGGTLVSCIIASPVITSGVSFDVLDGEDAAALGRFEGEPRFDHVFVLGQRSGPDGVSMDDILQMCGRVRGSPTLHVYLSKMKPRVLSADELRERWLYRAARAGAAVFQATPPGQGLRVAPDFSAVVDMAARMEHRRLLDHAQGHELLVERLVEAGWTIGEGRTATEEEKKAGQERGKKRRKERLAEIFNAPPFDSAAPRSGTVTGPQLAAADIRQAIGYPPDRRFAPADEALVRIHLAREREGGLPAFLSVLAARAADGGFLDALRDDAHRQGMTVTADGVALPRHERRFSRDGKPSMERVEPLAPQDQLGAVRGFELRHAALQAGGIDVRAALGELRGVVVRADQLDRVHRFLVQHRREVERLGLVTTVAEDGAAARRKNAQTLLDWWGLAHERVRSGPQRGSWRVAMPPRVRDALHYSGRGAPPAPPVRREDPFVAEVRALFEGWPAGTFLGAKQVLDEVDARGLVEVQGAVARPTEAGRARAMGMLLASWVKTGAPVPGWTVRRKSDTTSGRGLYRVERVVGVP